MYNCENESVVNIPLGGIYTLQTILCRETRLYTCILILDNVKNVILKLDHVTTKFIICRKLTL